MGLLTIRSNDPGLRYTNHTVLITAILNNPQRDTTTLNLTIHYSIDPRWVDEKECFQILKLRYDPVEQEYISG